MAEVLIVAVSVLAGMGSGECECLLHVGIWCKAFGSALTIGFCHKAVVGCRLVFEELVDDEGIGHGFQRNRSDGSVR